MHIDHGEKLYSFAGATPRTMVAEVVVIFSARSGYMFLQPVKEEENVSVPIRPIIEASKYRCFILQSLWAN